MLSRRFRRRPSPALVVSMLALVVSMTGTGIAATGGTFILGKPNSAETMTSLTTPLNGSSLAITNTSTEASATALKLTTDPGKPPMKVNSTAKVANLNADRLDNLDSSAFLRNAVPLTLLGTLENGRGVLEAHNLGDANGVYGSTPSSGASGVYGENTGGGFGVAARSNEPDGVGVLAEAHGGGGARALVARSNGEDPTIDAGNSGEGVPLKLAASDPATPPMEVSSRAKVANLNADQADGTSFVANRVVSSTQSDHILDVPGFGHFYVDGCDTVNTRWGWTSGGPATYVFEADLMNIGDPKPAGVTTSIVSATRARHLEMIQLARDTGGTTKIATVWLSANAPDCVFAAQAMVNLS